MFVKQRRDVSLDVIAFPATKTAGTAVTISSEELKPFIDNPGELNVHLIASDDSLITDNLTVTGQVSYDEGETWLTAFSYTDLDYGSSGDAVSSFKSEAIKFAPMVKLNGVFDASGALAENHGCKVHTELKEGEGFYRYDVDTDIITVPATLSVTADVAADGELTLTGVVLDGETVSVDSDTYEFAADAAQTVEAGNIAVDITSYTTASQGTLTVDTQPSVGDTFVIGDTTYTFVADVDADTAGEVSVGTDLPTAQANIVAAINGTDAFNTANTYAEASAFDANVSTITALVGGTAGDTITTTETFTAETNIFDDTTLGTTTPGVDCTAANAITALVAAEVASGTEPVTFADETGDVMSVTADVAGSAGNSISTTETLTNGSFADETLTGGSDSVDVTTTGDDIEINDRVEKVIVVASSDASKLTDITFKAQSSFNGNSWWDVSTEVDVSASNFLETEITDKLGSHFRVLLIADEDTGDIAEDHNIKFNLISLYN